jgi:hypothetical protein
MLTWMSDTVSPAGARPSTEAEFPRRDGSGTLGDDLALLLLGRLSAIGDEHHFFGFIHLQPHG